MGGKKKEQEKNTATVKTTQVHQKEIYRVSYFTQTNKRVLIKFAKIVLLMYPLQDRKNPCFKIK